VVVATTGSPEQGSLMAAVGLIDYRFGRTAEPGTTTYRVAAEHLITSKLPLMHTINTAWAFASSMPG